MSYDARLDALERRVAALDTYVCDLHGRIARQEVLNETGAELRAYIGDEEAEARDAEAAGENRTHAAPGSRSDSPPSSPVFITNTNPPTGPHGRPIVRQPDGSYTEARDACPGCGGPADNGHDRSVPPVAYYCTKCAGTPSPAFPSEAAKVAAYAAANRGHVFDGLRAAYAVDRPAIEAAAVRAFAEWYNIPDVADRYLAERKDA